REAHPARGLPRSLAGACAAPRQAGVPVALCELAAAALEHARAREPARQGRLDRAPGTRPSARPVAALRAPRQAAVDRAPPRAVAPHLSRPRGDSGAHASGAARHARAGGVMADARPHALIVGPLPPPPGGVGMQVEAILRSPLAKSWKLEVFNTSKKGQEGKPSTVTLLDVLWTMIHISFLPLYLLGRPKVALV